MALLAGKGWSSYALSLRNHPGSHEVADEEYRVSLRVSDYAEDVAAVTGWIGRPCVVVGHSLGGIVAQRYLANRFAAGRSEAGMVLLASVPPGALGPIRDGPIPTDVPYLLEPAEAAERYFRAGGQAAWGETVARLVPESPSVMNHYSLAPGVKIAPDAIPCPRLVVSAGHERGAVPRDDRIARYYGAEYYPASEVGHDLMLDEGWGEVLGQVEGWLAGVFGTG